MKNIQNNKNILVRIYPEHNGAVLIMEDLIGFKLNLEGFIRFGLNFVDLRRLGTKC